MPLENLQVLMMVFGSFIGVVGFIVVIAVVFTVIRKRNTQTRQDDYAARYAEKRKADALEAQRKYKEELQQRLAQKYGLKGYGESDKAQTYQLDDDDDDDDEYEDEDYYEEELEKNPNHPKHVADSHAHGHLGKEEHYEEIVGSLGEVNDEGCADLNGVRFLANDLSYEIQSQESPDYDRIAQAVVLGEIINSPRFKTPYSRRK